jgi:hypothetical protein
MGMYDPDDAKRIEQLEAALREIERHAQSQIDKFGILNKPPGPPEAWTTRVDALLETVAPIRDKARAALAGWGGLGLREDNNDVGVRTAQRPRARKAR